MISDPRHLIPVLPNQVDAGDDESGDGVPVGSGDVAADKARTGADDAVLDADAGPRDSDGVPVGRGDVDADVRRSGGDPDAV